ncbi:hypothetical protein [Nocardioides sp. KR10-350]|uniref:hypothetical protein n=1 Tax=Nocardioides cheoyonin TaxID=3156615 RepID=UPI0032B34DDF
MLRLPPLFINAFIQRREGRHIERHHNQPEQRPELSLLDVMRGVESTPPGDLEWALHCTRQQAVLLSLQLAGEGPPTLDRLADAIGTPISITPDLPTPSAALYYPDGEAAILVHEELGPEDRVRAAVAAIKHHLDLPKRLSPGANGFTDSQYAAIAEAFADTVLGTE